MAFIQKPEEMTSEEFNLVKN